MTEITPILPEPKHDFKHNWLYSVLPLHGFMYLVGYCRICDQALSVSIPSSTIGNIKVVKMGIPKWGCIDPNNPF